MALHISVKTLPWLLIGTLLISSPSYAKKSTASSATPKKSSPLTLSRLADRHYDLMASFVQNSLRGKGKKDFQLVSATVKTNIQWRNDQNTNHYNEAFKRSFEFVKTFDLKGMPETIMLLPYMESQWKGNKGKKSGDYGYWQFMPDVIREIKQLDYVSSAIKATPINKLRADAHLSSEAALIHLHRYHFYFSKVANYSESDAWLLTFQAYNWGAGNVKRLMAELEAEGIKPNFANFYHRLYQVYSENPNDRTLRAAVQYIPSLWNMAQLLKEVN